VPPRFSLTSSTLLAATAAVYLPHLAEEALTGMHDDAIIVWVAGVLDRSDVLASLTPRHAVYLTFQLTLALLLVATWLTSLGGRWRDLVLFALGLSLLGESHHVVRWLVTHHASSGLVTSLPMPLLGVLILRRVTSSPSPSHASPSPAS
jgi:hypothetical protein